MLTFIDVPGKPPVHEKSAGKIVYHARKKTFTFDIK